MREGPGRLGSIESPVRPPIRWAVLRQEDWRLWPIGPDLDHETERVVEMVKCEHHDNCIRLDPVRGHGVNRAMPNSEPIPPVEVHSGFGDIKTDSVESAVPQFVKEKSCAAAKVKDRSSFGHRFAY